MMAALQDDILARRAALRMEAGRCRDIWVAVVHTEMRTVSASLDKLRRMGAAEAVNCELGVFRRWLNSKDGRVVLDLAGISPSDRSVERILSAVARGDLHRRGEL